VNYTKMYNKYIEEYQRLLSTYKPRVIKKSDKEPHEIWVIMYEDEPITVPSGKSSWKRIGHAKNALRNALECLYFIPSTNPYDWKERQKAQSDSYDKLLESGIIKFINILEDANLLNKEYTWEALTDLEQDIFWALDDMPGEFDGVIKVKVTRCDQR